jgi:hypothetical protein
MLGNIHDGSSLKALK